jgi:hypothetical protein
MRSALPKRVAGAALLAFFASCASVEFRRDTETSGTFYSRGMSFTMLSVDMPKAALDIARENVSDARLPNVQVTEARVWPYLGPFDWLLEIIGVRRATVRGTWGYAEN